MVVATPVRAHFEPNLRFLANHQRADSDGYEATPLVGVGDFALPPRQKYIQRVATNVQRCNARLRCSPGAAYFRPVSGQGALSHPFLCSPKLFPTCSLGM